MRRPSAAALLVAVGALAGCGGGGDATKGERAAARAGQFVVWRYPGGNTKPPLLAFRTPAKPAKGKSVADPVYHTRITRVTDKAVDRYADPAIVNEYARVDPENATGTRALLRGVGGNWCLYDATTFRMIRPVRFRGNSDPEPRWHPTDPNLCHFVEGSSLWRYNAATNRETRVHDFKRQDARCAFVRTRYEGEPSKDGRYWCFRLEDGDFNLLRVVTYDLAQNRILGQLSKFAADSDYVTMDLGGKHCFIAYNYPARGASYHRDFTHKVLLPSGIGHADVGIDTAGRDVLVYQNGSTDWIAMADLETGKETNLLPIPFSDNLDLGLHFSCNATQKPGWVLVSTYGSVRKAKSWMDQSLFLVQLKAKPVVWRVCQTLQFRDASVEKDYFGEAFAAINGRGTRVWWGANWNAAGAGNHRYETYFANLPANWEAAVLAAAK